MKSALLLMVMLAGSVVGRDALAQDAPPKAIEELIQTLMRKGVITEPEARPILDLFSKEQKDQKPEVSSLWLPKGVSLKMGTLGQFRYTYSRGDLRVGTNPTSSFKVHTARLKFSGDLPMTFKYALTLAFERANGATTQANSALYDAKLIYAPKAWLNITAGQFVIPVSAESNIPSDQIDLAERYYAAGRMLNPSTNRDVGVMADGKLLNKRLYYALGMFNGRGPNYADNSDSMHLYAARLEGTPLRWTMSGQPSGLLVGINGMWKRTSNDPSSLKSSDIPGRSFTQPFDRYVWSYNGTLSVGPAALKGEYLAAKLKGLVPIDPVVNAEGWYVQGSVKTLGGRLEPLARYQGYQPDDAVIDAKDLRWTTLGLNWYINGQSSRLLANYTFKRERRGAYANDELVLQYQLSF
ncbi:MAG: porin [Elusimicrobiota bacterium]